MKRWLGVPLFVLLAGCATPPAGDTAGGNVASSVADSESRQRARAFTDLAAAYFNRGQYKIALDELRKAILVDNQFGPAYNIYGLIYMDLAEDRLAEENFRKAVDLNRNDSETRNNFGWFLCTRGRHNEGMEQFRAAIRNPLYDKPELAMANAGLCAELKGDLAEAEANLTRSLKLQPDNPYAILKMAGLVYRQNRLAEAQRLLARHAELSAPTAESLWLGVNLERRLGDRAQEAAYGLQLRKRFPDSKEARLLASGQYE